RPGSTSTTTGSPSVPSAALPPPCSATCSPWTTSAASWRWSATWRARRGDENLVRSVLALAFVVVLLASCTLAPSAGTATAPTERRDDGPAPARFGQTLV